MPLLRALLLVLLLAPPALAASGDPALPKPDPKGHWRVIGQDDATTTSRCIGDLSTPLCAMETYMASGVREDDSLFRKAALLLPGEQSTVFGDTANNNSKKFNEFMKYRILSAKVLLDKDIPPHFMACQVPEVNNCKERKSAWQTGDVRILITSRDCYNHKCAHKEGADRGHVLRRIGKEWKVVLMRFGITRVERVDGKGDWRE